MGIILKSPSDNSSAVIKVVIEICSSTGLRSDLHVPNEASIATLRGRKTVKIG